MISLSSHILDTTLGQPVEGMVIELTTPKGQSAQVVTNQDGRCNQWQDIELGPGVHTLRFHTGPYLLAQHGSAFYPYVDIHFEIQPNQGHYHIPLLISPYGYSSYRGS